MKKFLLYVALYSSTICVLAAQQQKGASLQRDPAQASRWVQTSLYFGLGPADVPSKGISETAWRDFLDREVTPRFPAGLSVADIYGQWQAKPTQTAERPERIRSKLLIIVHPATIENTARIDAIRAAWKQRTGDRSVLKVTHAVEVSF